MGEGGHSGQVHVPRAGGHLCGRCSCAIAARRSCQGGEDLFPASKLSFGGGGTHVNISSWFKESLAKFCIAGKMRRSR
jgi:hypothetical protein